MPGCCCWKKCTGRPRKLSASGNGRGNLSNVKCEDLEEVLKFFSETGIALRTDDEGRIYPYSEDARTVTETLIKRAETEGVVILNDTQVVNVEACSGKGTGFRVFVSGKNGDGQTCRRQLPKGTGDPAGSKYADRHWRKVLRGIWIHRGWL